MIYRLAFAGLIGLCLGSFAATAAVRLARGQQVLFGRSSCDHCAAPVNALQSLPIIGYLRQGGVCSQCRGRIDPAHLIGEMVGAAILMLTSLLTSPVRAAAVAALGLVLLTSALVDARTRRLPDGLSLAAALLCAAIAADRSFGQLVQGLVAALVVFVTLEAVRRGFLHFKKRAGLGFGDVKLVVALALWLGVATPWALSAACILGLATMAWIRPADGKIAFGPSLSLAGWMVGLAGEAHLWPALS